MTKELKCADRIATQWARTKHDLERYMDDGKTREQGDDELCPFHEYALSFDYVPLGTWVDQKAGYWRYQMSWGGPSDEIRFFHVRGTNALRISHVEYWFMDWFDGASLDVTDAPCIKWLWSYLTANRVVQSAYKEARAARDVGRTGCVA